MPFSQTDMLGCLFWPAKLLTNPFLNTEQSGLCKDSSKQWVAGNQNGYQGNTERVSLHGDK